ncbi:MAG: hypothetical protein RMY28_032970, partial [Nostoc sp. ChiSLP01]|nr:hypothetical protein [Nostoc sp. CmiSLP01]
DTPDISVIPTPIQQVIQTNQSSRETDTPDISVIPTPIQQVIQTDELSFEVENKSTTSQKNVIQKQEISSISNPRLAEQESLNKSNIFEEITAIEPNLISENYITNFDTGNFLLDDSAITSPNVENTLETHSSATLLPASDVKKSPIALEREIDSVTSEPLVSAPIQLTPASAYIEDTSNFLSDSDRNEQLANLESQSTVAVNVSDFSTNIISLQRDNNLESNTSESIENQLNLPLDEIDEPLIVSNILPEIGETEKVSNISPEIIEPPIVSNILPEISESPVVSNISPDIIEPPKINNISPEIGEVAKVRDVSSNVGETSSIFRKIVDNEQIVQSELLGAIANSENFEIHIPEYQDIPEKPTFLPNQSSTPPQFEQNTTIQNLAAPKGYATGGQVIDSHLENNQHIAASDTVPAMLTPGEFVINTRDAQKNLPLLQHINSGGIPDDIIVPSLETPNAKESQKATSSHSTKVDSFTDTSLQLKSQESNSLIPSFLGLNVGKHKLSVLNSPQLNTVENKTTDSPVTSPQYSSPPLIFRKTNSTATTSSQGSDTPSQWSSVQELFNGNNDEDEFTSFFSGGGSNSQNSEFSDVYTSSESSPSFAKHRAAPRGFAQGGEVTAPASVNTESVSETVQNTSAKGEEDNKDDTADLEALAREIYSRLRQRLEIERERHGGYLGRLSW